MSYENIMSVFQDCFTPGSARAVLGVLGIPELKILCRHYIVGVGELERALLKDLFVGFEF